MNHKINMQPENFHLEDTSVWSFPDHGNWATHNSKYRGNWSPYVPRNILLKYSKVGEIVLDQFLGGGTTLIEAKLLDRVGLGVDINENALRISKSKLNFNWGKNKRAYLRKGDARNLNFIPNNSIDLICMHPPYSDIIKYSKNNQQDLSLLDYNTFLESMYLVAQESFRVLKKNKYCAVLIGDIRRHGFIKPLGFEVLRKFEQVGFGLKEIIIKEQHNCGGTKKWVNKNKNFYLIAHEYLFILKKCTTLF